MVNNQTRLNQAIEAAKRGDKRQASDLLYAVLDDEPRNEIAWVWLSYIVDTPEDRRICLENALTINPASQYAIRGLAQLNGQVAPAGKAIAAAPVAKTQAMPASRFSAQPISEPGDRRQPVWWQKLALTAVTAFWAGLGFLFLMVGIIELVQKSAKLFASRNFPYYITPTQLWDFTIATAFLVGGILIFNLVWGLSIRHKISYFASILFSLGLIVLVPAVMLISGKTSYPVIIFGAAMPTTVLFLTLLCQVGFDHDQQMAS